MARELQKATTARGSRFGHAEPAREEIRPDDGNGFVWLTGEAIGLPPAGLLELARERLGEREQMLDKLLKNLPRKHEDKIKALNAPLAEARAAIQAVEMLLENQRRVFEAPDYGEQG